MPDSSPMSVDRARVLAADLIRTLAPLSGDEDAIDAEMRRWVDALDVSHFSMVCMAALQLVFCECLTPTPLRDLPADRLALLPPLSERVSA